MEWLFSRSGRGQWALCHRYANNLVLAADSHLKIISVMSVLENTVVGFSAVDLFREVNNYFGLNL